MSTGLLLVVDATEIPDVNQNVLLIDKITCLDFNYHPAVLTTTESFVKPDNISSTDLDRWKVTWKVIEEDVSSWINKSLETLQTEAKAVINSAANISTPVPYGTVFSSLNDVNESGVMVGMITIDSVIHPGIWNVDGTYTVLEVPDEATEADTAYINNLGVMVGSAKINGVFRPYKWLQDGTAINLSNNGEIEGWINDINDSGVMVGWGNGHPYKWMPNGTAINLGLPDGATQAWISCINNSGVMGGSAKINGLHQPYMWTPDGTPINLGMPSETAAEAWVESMNDDGIIIVGDDYDISYTWSPKTELYSVVPYPENAEFIYVSDINNLGMLVGCATMVDGDHGFIWTPDGTPIDLGILGCFYGINDNGVVVGDMYPSDWSMEQPIAISTKLLNI